MSKRVLVIGSTGAMGSYMVPCLADLGYEVTAVSLDEEKPCSSRVECVRGNAWDPTFLEPLVKKNYDGIVNFLSYPKVPFRSHMDLFLDHTDQYVFLSSCRVYANEEIPVRESSPRLLDVSTDKVLLASNDYCIHKAKAENLLVFSERKNWTIVRPATILSRRRLPLVTLETANVIGRARAGKKAVVPIQAKDKPATLSWGGDVGPQIARLLFKEEALGGVFNVCSAEHRTWGEIAEYYRELCGLESVWVDKEDYLRIIDPLVDERPAARWQLEVARMFDRITDNSKVLRVTEMKQEDMKPMRQALKEMIEAFPADYSFKEDPIGQRMDAYLEAHGE